MVIKSLTITEDAYDALKSLKHGDESFSEAILRVAKKKMSVEKFFGVWKMSEKEAAELKREIKKTRKEMEKEFAK
jgi:predicted CopG family antitoxin